MSLFEPRQLACGHCGGTGEVLAVASVNADRRADLRAAILDGTFQRVPCEHCGGMIRLPAQLNYLDIGRGQWIVAEPGTELPRWRDIEASAQALFDTTYGARAPRFGRELGSGLTPRLVFGWPALREKLLCRELGLEDLALELLKLAVMRCVPGSPLADDTEFRLVAGDAAELHLMWLRAADEQGAEAIVIGRDIYEAIAADPVAWAALRTSLCGGMFVDMTRIVAG
jgi:hypothetical protein